MDVAVAVVVCVYNVLVCVCIPQSEALVVCSVAIGASTVHCLQNAMQQSSMFVLCNNCCYRQL
jgi:uncharacterized membrane protein YgdD (TMEM256/DUF423 family)